MSRWSTLRLAAALLATAPLLAQAGDLYSYVDADGVLHFSNAPSDGRFRRVTRANDVAGVYRSSAPAVRSRPITAVSSGSPWVGAVREAAANNNLPEALILAVIAVESNFDPRAVSEKGAAGLMQLMPGTAREMYVADVFDPEQNIHGGTRYLRVLANQYGGDMVRMLAAYNAGPDAVRRAGGTVPNIPETREYVRKVVALYRAYKAGR
ncbi:MAG TPA: lytic transglycosylase domain-containing protein [Anaeromyxobacteraceae bacterium]|nr:lytic transglycosylase domain-containing protein [Anaeromyxobacteraceae bacterium]